MEDLNCLIVEDEHLAAEIIADYIRQVPGLKLAGICEDAMSANAFILKQEIDLIFLDINLPGISGIEFIQSLNKNYDIILTTAYHQYAVDAFNLDVVDYLLKPIEFARFLKAVNKVFEKKAKTTTRTTPPAEAPPTFHFFNVDRKQVKVMENDILFIESLKDYVRIHTIEKTLVTKFQIGQINELLDGARFIRIHKSYLVNIDKIDAFNSQEIEINNIELPIGRTYKELVETRLKSQRF